VAELFVYNFLGQEQQRQTLTFADFAANLATLMFSADALNGAWKTVLHNVVSGAPAYEIKPRGYFYYPPGHDAQGTFASGGMFDL
jgi:hypothetical protein